MESRIAPRTLPPLATSKRRSRVSSLR